MWTASGLCTVVLAVLLTLPRVIGIAVELGLNRETASSMWQVCVGLLRLHSFGRMLDLDRISVRQVDMVDRTCARSLGLVQERC
jgi:hypothetical protein